MEVVQMKQIENQSLLNWKTLEEQHKNTFKREYVACHEPHEFKWITENVQAVFPQFRKSLVERAIEEVCHEMKHTPRKRHEFFERLQVALETQKLTTKEALKKVSKL